MAHRQIEKHPPLIVGKCQRQQASVKVENAKLFLEVNADDSDAQGMAFSILQRCRSMQQSSLCSILMRNNALSITVESHSWMSAPVAAQQRFRI